MRLGALEIVLILLVALVLFGGNKLAGVGKALGQSIHDFKKEINRDDDEDDKSEKKAGKEKKAKKDEDENGDEEA